jgi:HPt (histidine-containing phosphotransfer) domain-containing protein
MSIDSIAPAVVLDVEGTLARLGGDQKLFVEIATFLLEDAPRLFADLREAVLAGDATAVECKAHKLKGLLINCGGVRASHAAQFLEDSGNTRDLSNSDCLIESLESELDLLTSAIRAYRQ